MRETKINISELKSDGSDLIKELAGFLKEKTKAEVETTIDAIIVKGEGGSVSKKFLRVLLRKFLHKNDLKYSFRVIAHEENALIVKEKKMPKEEE